jgi:hypothetical protein
MTFQELQPKVTVLHLIKSSRDEKLLSVLPTFKRQYRLLTKVYLQIKNLKRCI